MCDEFTFILYKAHVHKPNITTAITIYCTVINIHGGPSGAAKPVCSDSKFRATFKSGTEKCQFSVPLLMS